MMIWLICFFVGMVFGFGNICVILVLLIIISIVLMCVLLVGVSIGMLLYE